ncbi:COL6A [Mytilus edulis]|uniref:COL6A n=1 Tax=Mytilus edulis TaxID=6550 RepID=A0A8S3PP84_MYTED|nr:COL6A [Mytilus edulis]
MSEYGDTVTVHFSLCKQTLSERHYRKLYVVREIRQGCSTKADVTFVLDSSDTVGQTNFAKQLNFVKNTVNNLDVGGDKVRVSTVTFSSGVHNQFFLNNYGTKADVMNAISGIKYLPGNTDTGDAIKYVTQTTYTPQHGSRSGVPHIMVLVTDGPSVTKDITKLRAQTAKDNGVIVYTVGVGGGFDRDELKSVSSNPDSLKADLVFMIDSSNTVGALNLEKTENFIKNFVTKLNVSKDGVHVGIEQYGSRPSAEFPLRMYNNRYDVLTAIHGMQIMGGGTNTGDAIEFAKTTMFSPAAGARSNVPRIAIMVTDGGTSETAAAIAEADKARAANIGLIGVGVGGLVNMQELNGVANQPSASHVITVSNYDQLEAISNQLMTMTCGDNRCAYKGKSYSPGQKWNDGCDYECVCQDGATGKYQCYNRCPVYYNLPSLCTLVRKPGECCLQPVCNFNPSIQKFESAGKGQNQQGIGTSYKQGEVWSPKCDERCSCENAKYGYYRCVNTCPKYTNMSPTCVMSTDLNDPCCTAPKCTFDANLGKVPQPLPTFGKSTLTYAVVSPQTGATQNQGFTNAHIKLINTVPTPQPPTVDPGKLSAGGETWEVGCQYNCICDDGITGHYKCVEKCVHYTNLPPKCYLLQDPSNPCCKKPECPVDPQYEIITGVRTTPSSKQGRSNVCIYKGQAYKQGAIWEDGCDYTCTCEDELKGVYFVQTGNVNRNES